MRIIYYSLVLLCLPIMVARAQTQPQNQPASQGQPTPLQPQDQPTQPVPPDRSPYASPVGTPVVPDTVSLSGLNPDTRSLAGAQLLSLGIPATHRTVWNPYVSLTTAADSEPLTFGQSGWTTWDSLAVGLDLRHTSLASDLQLTYFGSGWTSNQSGVGTYVTQQLGIAETFRSHRYSISLIDQVGYLPEAAFGFGNGFGSSFGLSGSSAAAGTLGLQAGFSPDQLILTGLGQRLSNTFITEIDRHLTPRSELTFVGSYGLLHYFQNNLVNDSDVVLQGGYSHQMNRKDTIAFFYQFAGYRFQNVNQSIDNHSVQVSYARRVTGRLTFQVAAGPDLSVSRTPFNNCGAGCIQVVTPSGTRQFSWSASSTLNYQLRRTGLGLFYSHGVTSGSGILLGGLADNASGSVNRQFTRTLGAAWLVGYSRSSGFALGAGSTQTNQTYNFGYTGLTLNRTLGRSVFIDLSYQAQYQTANSAFCITTPCGTSFLLHQASLGFRWSPRPRPL
jgi:hypothetical protein